jgi:aspartyl/asparaginyl beta-hydroxylase (cupin superfamily)
MRPMVGTAAEPRFLYAVDGPYEGVLPSFYDPSTLPAAAALEAGFEVIRDEVLGLLASNPLAFSTNFTPEGYEEPGWQTINLCTDGRRYHANRARLPRTTAICDGLVGFCSAQVGVLAPGCTIRPHHGDTNLMYRLHLGLVVPGGLPELGIQVGEETRTWSEGRVLAFEDAHRHSVWNRTDHPRVVLVVDVIKEELRHRRRWLSAQAGAGIVLQLADAKVPAVRRLPGPVRRLALLVGAVGVWVALPLQRRLGRAR